MSTYTPPADRAPIDAVFAALASAWDAGDAAAYADLFTPDATYVVFDGTVLRGRPAIEDVHRLLFEGPLKGSRLTGMTQQPPPPVRFLHPDVAHVVVGGAVAADGEPQPGPDRASVASFVLVGAPEGWRIAAFQNTRVQERPHERAHEQAR
jgi:uncharacterized protein (TIGR02246 family)